MDPVGINDEETLPEYDEEEKSENNDEYGIGF
jgi:hypothetical protein